VVELLASEALGNMGSLLLAEGGQGWPEWLDGISACSLTVANEEDSERALERIDRFDAATGVGYQSGHLYASNITGMVSPVQPSTGTAG
jgi:hypothetical protein